FWLGLWSPCANAAVSLGRTGGWRLWKRDKEDDRWKQDVAITGHVKEVKSIAWSRSGAYLLSTGNDQTTRLHAVWKIHAMSSCHLFSTPRATLLFDHCQSIVNKQTTRLHAEWKRDGKSSWHEFSRQQI